MNEERNDFWVKSICLPIEVFANNVLDKNDLIIFSLIDMMDGENHCWASNKYMADVANVTIKTVSKAVSRLEEEGYIIRDVLKEEGNKRVLKISPSFRQEHLQHAKDINERINSRRKILQNGKSIPIELGVYSYRTKVLDNKIKEQEQDQEQETNSIQDQEPDRIEFVGRQEPRPHSPFQEPLIRVKIYRDPFNNIMPSAKNLFLYWNSLGKPLPHHETKPTTKTFIKATRDLELLLRRGYNEEEIKASMDNYKFVLDIPQSILRHAWGSTVGLCEFIKFSNKTKQQIAKNNPPLIGMDSWFEECLKSREELEIKWSKIIPDEHPNETKELKKLWKEFGGRKLDAVNDENTFRRISKKAYDYFTEIDKKYNWGMLDKYVMSKLHYMFDALQAEGQDFRLMKPHYLLADNMFSERLPNHWERICLSKYVPEPEWKKKEEWERGAKNREFNSHFALSHQIESREQLLAKIAAQNAKLKDSDEFLDDSMCGQ